MPAFRVAEEVSAALAAGRPVVALESTIITHGLPRPDNAEEALGFEEVVRSNGATPATIGVIGGLPTIGLSGAEIRRLANASKAVKASSRDLPLVRAARSDAGTTVAATAFLAHKAGIRVFATGGIGGVHRNAAETFDESADLSALARTPITVVSAGVKSVLDLPATLERLETLGVTIVGYRTRNMPWFYVADSGLPLEWSVSGPEELASVMASRDDLGLESALLVANPVPADEQLDPRRHLQLLEEALVSAEERRLTGQAVTPFLLDHIYRASEGKSLEANLAAVRHNAAVAAAIAAAWSNTLRPAS